MKKCICLFIVLACITSQAQSLRMMKIYQHNGTTDTTSLSRLDSVTISTNQTNFILHLKSGSTTSIAINQIDSILWPYVGGPVYQITQPTAGQIFHVGDSVTVTWNFNPAPAGQKAYFKMSIDGGSTFSKWLTNIVCWMMFRDSGMVGKDCYGGYPYVAWPYVVTNGKYVGTWKFKITNPMAMPDPMADVFNPISDSVIIKIIDYDHPQAIFNTSPMFMIKP